MTPAGTDSSWADSSWEWADSSWADSSKADSSWADSSWADSSRADSSWEPPAKMPRGGKRHNWESARFKARQSGEQALTIFLRTHKRPNNTEEDEQFKKNYRW